MPNRMKAISKYREKKAENFALNTNEEDEQIWRIHQQNLFSKRMKVMSNYREDNGKSCPKNNSLMRGE